MPLLILLSLLTLNDTLRVDVWVDKEDAVYYPTENLRVFFKTNQDCYIAVYDIDVGGRENLLFPPERDDGWTEGDREYELPTKDADYDYVISGPQGIETIVVIASRERLPKLHDEGLDIVKKSIEIYIKEPEPAKLRIISTPKHCQIYIKEVSSGEEYVSKAPRTFVIRPGEYLIKIKKFGFGSLTRKIWLEPGEKRRVFVRLRRY